MKLIAVGRIGGGAEAVLFAEYAKRLRPSLVVLEARDDAAILAGLGDSAPVLVLDRNGEMLDSEGFAAIDGPRTAWVIGGPEGLSEAVLRRADRRIAFGRLTWPHRLARVMLAEQLYRAQCIRAGHPYHK